jgi:hypothetical protein
MRPLAMSWTPDRRAAAQRAPPILFSQTSNPARRSWLRGRSEMDDLVTTPKGSRPPERSPTSSGQANRWTVEPQSWASVVECTAWG